jgi:hypothetical protein
LPRNKKHTASALAVLGMNDVARCNFGLTHHRAYLEASFRSTWWQINSL